MPSDAAHWDGVYRTRSETEVGWYEARPTTLLDVVELAPQPGARIVLVADSHVHHYPSKLGRMAWDRFGTIEVRNRLYFVRKHRLSVPRCFLGLGVRFFLSIGQGIRRPRSGGLRRAWGNLRGLAKYAVPRVHGR